MTQDTNRVAVTAEHERMAAELAAHPSFRVMREFDPESLFRASEVPDSPDVGLAVALDTETTGKDDVAKNRIIELGMVSFAYDRRTGRVLSALERYNALEDPGMPIPPEATKVNGITDEMVAGQRIDDAAVESLVEMADFVVAHHAGFDRPYCERRFPVFRDKAWACSMSQVDWLGAGMVSAKLEVIGMQQGFFYSAHRAEVDCLAMLRVLDTPLAALDGRNALSEVLAKMNETTFRLWAVGAPFDAKDLLKGRNYRWNDGTKPGSEKAWAIEVPESELEAELDWLKATVFRSKSIAVPVDRLDALTRFSERRGKTERIVR